MDTLLEILNPNFLLRNALYGGLIIGLVAPAVGVFLLARRLVFIGIALPQVSTAGVAAAFVWHTYFHGHLNRDVSDFVLALVGSSILTFAVILVLALLERRGRGLGEGRIGMLYAIAGAVIILLLASDRVTEIGVLGLLKGEIIAIPDIELLILLLGYGTILAVLTVFHKELVLVTVDREMAISLGKRVALWDLVLFGIIGVTISLGVLVVGPLVMFGFLIVPPMIAGRLVVGMRSISIVAALVGAGIALGGFASAYRLDLPTGPTDVALAGIVLAVVMAWQFMRTFVFRTAVQ
ncbi:MAG TPA: metal ABC transporter permease [Nitrospirales bacterium]|jgi:ABC-type Mn2+/Zn2+ transport system permease subunit|nr:metal ABC transporter permease [Nitrospirales bacterium]